MGSIVNFNKPTDLDILFEKLEERRERIEHMTVILAYDDGSVDVFHDEQKISQLCLTEKVLSSYIQEILY